ncbi:hypothetical protein M419DRAFT_117118 [Trichoderma reesei RUT C-30]|uniref:Uncharacterized protein n=1 Tax=Hypocrea jecorina (strain ATCC 56765 / BCRC 32924 / NRRL 11460 / Rut C-30) TaxID=1344414 RepID=A0A024SKI6_HYPJR|nr:hypothetical protein M419DRAFT_117118 [Trichoderma reesei RUT C-30]
MGAKPRPGTGGACVWMGARRAGLTAICRAWDATRAGSPGGQEPTVTEHDRTCAYYIRV